MSIMRVAAAMATLSFGVDFDDQAPRRYRKPPLPPAPPKPLSKRARRRLRGKAKGARR